MLVAEAIPSWYEQGTNAMSNEDLQRFYAGRTGRQQDVLYWVSRGLTNPEIAERLFISSNVVAEHLTNIYAEFGLFIESDKPIKRHDILRYYGGFFDDYPHFAPSA
jgi:FixJ family two-component response regulator